MRLIRQKSLDPLPVLTEDDLETCVRRAGVQLPPNWYGREPHMYKMDLLEVTHPNFKAGFTYAWALFPAGSTSLSTSPVWYSRPNWTQSLSLT